MEPLRQDYFSYDPAVAQATNSATLALQRKESLAAKREANKTSAKKSRKKKQQSLKEMQEVIAGLEAKNNALLLQVSTLETEKSLWSRRESEFDGRMSMLQDQLRLVTGILKNQQ